MSGDAPLREACARLAADSPLGPELAGRVMAAMVAGQATPAQTGAFLLGYQLRGPRPAELAAFVRAMRAVAVRVRGPAGAVDLCGTGGDGRGTFNVSTTAAFVAAAAGAVVAKHGNRAASSRCGSADVLEALGIAIATPADAERQLAEHGLTFMFAPHHHPATRHVVGPRRELGLRTVFNLLGPLTNPAGTTRQLIGIFDGALAGLVAETLRELGAERAWIVHGSDGTDELTICGTSAVTELTGGQIRRFEVAPADVGLTVGDADALAGGTPAENAMLTEAVLRGQQHGAARDVVCLNAGAELLLAGQAEDLTRGVARAAAAIDEGRAAALLEALRG